MKILKFSRSQKPARSLRPPRSQRPLISSWPSRSSTHFGGFGGLGSLDDLVLEEWPALQACSSYCGRFQSWPLSIRSFGPNQKLASIDEFMENIFCKHCLLIYVQMIFALVLRNHPNSINLKSASYLDKDQKWVLLFRID